mmetsp:Transcript_4092/g.6841  ORF Transcript_4092/g.6841 Transcript_4092/m.6841 type:complete len:423 (-) Transcript_4092:109-1377(-)
MGAQCSCQVPEEVDANEEFPLTPSKEYYSSKHGDCFQVGEDASYTVRSAGSTSIPSDECSCPNDSKELGFKETDSQEDFMLTVQSSRSCRSYHLAGLPGDDGLSQASKGSLARLQMLVEGADFLGAEVELTKLMDELADPAFADERAIISASPLVMHIKDELRLYREVAQHCCQFTQPDSFLLYSNEHLHQSIHGSFDRHNPRVFHYHLRMVFPFQLAHVFSVAFEEELSTEWNSMLLKTPELIENEQGLHTVTSSQASAMLGLLKLDFLDRTQRFIDVEGGMLVEYVKTVEEGYDCHRPPIKGFKRVENDLKSIWAACGPEKTLLLQAGTVQLPIPVTKWLATSIGGLAGRHLISNMVKTAQRATQPGNPWDKAMAEDTCGIYSKLYQCAQSPASLARSRDRECHLSNSDFQRFFNRTLPH